MRITLEIFPHTACLRHTPISRKDHQQVAKIKREPGTRQQQARTRDTTRAPSLPRSGTTMHTTHRPGHAHHVTRANYNRQKDDYNTPALRARHPALALEHHTPFNELFTHSHTHTPRDRLQSLDMNRCSLRRSKPIAFSCALHTIRPPIKTGCFS